MKKRHKAYIKINIVSLLFMAVSFISVSLAWFAYSGLSSVSTDITVKSWNIEIKKNGEKVSNDVVISLSDIYPGMNTLTETININNLGDSDASLSYSIESARILDNPLDNYIVDSNNPTEYVEDQLSHKYPFHVNMNLTNNFVVAKTGEEQFQISLSWPLDSGDDSFDSEWGNLAYQFQDNEIQAKENDSDYQVKPPIQIVIKVTAEQYTESSEASDLKYALGTEIMYDPIGNSSCELNSDNCIKTYVIDRNNKVGDHNVSLLPDINSINNLTTFENVNQSIINTLSTWNVPKRSMETSDILNIISKDIYNSVIIKENISDQIIGNLNYTNRFITVLNDVIDANGYFKFNNTFSYLSSNSCFWLGEYNENNGFAVKNNDDNTSKMYAEIKTNSCNAIPIIIAPKANI